MKFVQNKISQTLKIIKILKAQMRENNHIAKNNYYNDFSSFKIRQPFNQNSFLLMNNSSQLQKNQQMHHQNREIDSAERQHSTYTSSFYSKHPSKQYGNHDEEQNSRQMSNNSRGSNVTFKSMKISDYIALEAKNLIQNRDKYKYDGQSHIRSSSMHCELKNFKVGRSTNEKQYNYLNNKQLNQPTQIPSFGIDCRTTISTEHHFNDKSYFSNKYPQDSYKLEDPSNIFRAEKRNIKTQIDQRIEKLIASSSSLQQRQRISYVKKIDDYRLQNMDKINVKIKNILTTLQQQQGNFKNKFFQGPKRIKTETSVALQDRYDQMLEQENEQILLSKCLKKSSDSAWKENSRYNNSRSNFDNNLNESFLTHHQIPQKYWDQHVSSYYYCDDQSAMMKSTQSPLKSSPQKLYQKLPVQKDRKTQIAFKYPNQSQMIKIIPSISQKNESNRHLHQPQKLYNLKKLMKDSNAQTNLFNNVPECQTEIIESKKFETLSNAFVEGYLTFDRKKEMGRSCIEEKIQPTTQGNNYQKKFFNQEAQSNKSHYIHDFSDSGFEMQRKLNFILFDHNLPLHNQEKRMHKQKNLSKENKKKSNLLYFNNDDQGKYLKSSQKIKTCEGFSGQINEFSQKALHQDQKQVKFEQADILNLSSSNNFSLKTQNQELTFNSQMGKNYLYSDSIKETLHFQKARPNQTQNQFVKNNAEYARSDSFKTSIQEELDRKLERYEQRLKKYQNSLSASNILSTQRSRSFSNKKSKEESCKMRNSHQKRLKQSQPHRECSAFNVFEFTRNQNLAYKQSEKVEKFLNNIKRQREAEQQQKKVERVITQKQKNLESSDQDEYQGNRDLTRLKPIPKYSPIKQHYFSKTDHQNFIQNLRKHRQQAAQLSQRKSSQNLCLSFNWAKGQTSNQKSLSSKSRLSSNTIVKGRNIDQQIEKIQKKMSEYQQMKKDLNLTQRQNTQRQTHKQIQVQQFQHELSLKNMQLQKNQLKKSSEIQIQNEIKQNLFSQTELKNGNRASDMKSLDYLKMFTEQNSFVKLRKSILKEQKSNQIKTYLNQQIQKQSNQHPLAQQKKPKSLLKCYPRSTKQNILPQLTATIESPKYPNLIKKLRLVQNLHNQFNQQINQSNQQLKNQVKTPKLLRNLKSKLLNKSFAKKKAQKRGWRSQFINDLHQQNQIITSANISDKAVQSNEFLHSTSRCLLGSKELFTNLLSLIEKQILIDEKFRIQKKIFNCLSKTDKWKELMSEYIRQRPSEKNILLSDIVKIFTLNEQQNDPLYSTRGVEFSFACLVESYASCKQNWENSTKELAQVPVELLTVCGLNAKNLDIQRKGYIEIEDLVRLVNMELNKYYRKRDLWLIWQRIFESSSGQKKQLTDAKITIDQFLKGFGSIKQTV